MDFSHREGLQQSDVERWLGFITFLCEVFGTMRSSSGEPFRVLVCPIYTCLREVSISATYMHTEPHSVCFRGNKATSQKHPDCSHQYTPRQFPVFSARPSLDGRHHSRVWLVVQRCQDAISSRKMGLTPGSDLISWSCSLTHRPPAPPPHRHIHTPVTMET